jgi:hypothetical protein
MESNALEKLRRRVVWDFGEVVDKVMGEDVGDMAWAIGISPLPRKISKRPPFPHGTEVTNSKLCLLGSQEPPEPFVGPSTIPSMNLYGRVVWFM